MDRPHSSPATGVPRGEGCKRGPIRGDWGDRHLQHQRKIEPVAAAGPPYRLLFCDDDESMLRLMVAHFEHLGHEVHQASSGEECLDRHAEVKPEVTVLDIDMPGMSGMEVLPKLRRQNASVIMLTAQSEIKLAIQALKQGAENYLIKPTDMSHLAEMIDRAVEKLRSARA